MEELTNQKRLELISNMISEAKSHVARNGSSQILLWGWVITLANLGHYFLEFIKFEMPYIVWLAVIPAGFYSGYLGRKMARSSVRSHIDSLYGQIWIAIAIVIFITLMMMGQLNFHHNPIILAVAGAGMYITGKLLRFRPVFLGAAVLWFGALIEWQLSIEWHYLISAIAVFIGYLIPGYLLKRSERE